MTVKIQAAKFAFKINECIPTTGKTEIKNGNFFHRNIHFKSFFTLFFSKLGCIIQLHLFTVDLMFSTALEISFVKMWGS